MCECVGRGGAVAPADGGARAGPRALRGAAHAPRAALESGAARAAPRVAGVARGRRRERRARARAALCLARRAAARA